MADEEPVSVDEEEALSSDDAARLLDCTRSTVQKMVRDGRLQAGRTDEGYYRLRRQDVEELRQAQSGRRKPGRKSFWDLP